MDDSRKGLMMQNFIRQDLVGRWVNISHPFPLSQWPLEKGSLRTSTFAEEAKRAHYKPRMARESGPNERPDFVEDGIGYMLPDAVGGMATEGRARPIGPRGMTYTSSSTAPAIMKRSLRQFLRRRGYSDNAIDDIISDNHSSYKADLVDGRYDGIKKENLYRRPAYLFDPEAHDTLMKHLEQSVQEFGPGGTRIPRESLAYLLGTLSLDPESGTPFVHIKHAVPDTHATAYTDAITPNAQFLSRRLSELMTADPGLFIVGHAHTHPPGSLPYPSRQDIQANALGNVSLSNPYNLQIIHSANTIRVPSESANNEQREFLSGPKAYDYLRMHGLREHKSNPGVIVQGNDDDEYAVYDEPDLRTVGLDRTTTGFYSGHHGPQYDVNRTEGMTINPESLGIKPVTHSFPLSGVGAISTPNQVQFMGARAAPPNRLGSPEGRRMYISTGRNLNRLSPGTVSYDPDQMRYRFEMQSIDSPMYRDAIRSEYPSGIGGSRLRNKEYRAAAREFDQDVSSRALTRSFRNIISSLYSISHKLRKIHRD